MLRESEEFTMEGGQSVSLIATNHSFKSSLQQHGVNSALINKILVWNGLLSFSVWSYI